jgi:hypothetical protein
MARRRVSMRFIRQILHYRLEKGISADQTARFKDRGRDVDFSTPPAQIRTCSATAYGSYLEYLALKRTFGYG